MNTSKSEILKITIPFRKKLAIQPMFRFVWRREELGYLGIKLTTSLRGLYKTNYIPLLNVIKENLNSLKYISISWLGRINTFKMSITSITKVLYTFQMLPISLPQEYLKKLRTLILKYIWTHRRPRTSYAVLIKEKKAGGLALPDPKKYYQAVTIS